MYEAIKKIIVSYWLFLFFLLVALFMIVFGVSVKDVYNTVSKLQPWQILLLILVFLIVSAVHILSRKYLLYVLGAKCGLKNLAYIHFSTLAAHYSTPVKIGFPVAIYLLNKIENIDYSKSTAMLLLEIAIGTFLCALIAIIGLPALLDISLKRMSVFLVIISLMIITSLIGIMIINAKSKERGIFLTYVINIINTLRRFGPNKIIIYLIFSVFLRFLDGIILFLLCIFFSENLTIWQSVVTTSTAFFIGTISMVPMGLGTRDISILFLLQHYNISDDSAIVIVSLQRILTTGLSFLLGIYCGSILGIKNIFKEKQLQKQNQPEI